jgi:two-component system response regulator
MWMADDGTSTPRVERLRDGLRRVSTDYFFLRGAHAGRRRARSPRSCCSISSCPKVDGLDVLRALRADPRTRLIPIVILTSSGEDQDVVRGYGLGANSYVRKPVDFTQFVEAVRQLGLYWLVINLAAPA